MAASPALDAVEQQEAIAVGRAEGIGVVPPRSRPSRDTTSRFDLRVLFVDNNLQSVGEQISKLGELLTVKSVENAAEAISLIKKQKFDAAVVDLHIVNDSDPTDVSGILLARFLGRIMPTLLCSTPKNHHSLVAEVGPIARTLPKGVSYMSKDVDPGAFAKEVYSLATRGSMVPYQARVWWALILEVCVPLITLGLLLIGIASGLVAVATGEVQWMFGTVAALIAATPLLIDGDLLANGRVGRVLSERWREYLPAILLLLALGSGLMVMVSGDPIWLLWALLLAGASVLSVLLASGAWNTSLPMNDGRWLDTKLWLQYTPEAASIVLVLGIATGLISVLTANSKVLMLTVTLALFLAFLISLALPCLEQSAVSDRQEDMR
jgi:hypothetical protein